jgi:hypothetical protein
VAGDDEEVAERITDDDQSDIRGSAEAAHMVMIRRELPLTDVVDRKPELAPTQR